LKRSIQRLVENPLARALLEGRFKSSTTIKVDADPGSGTLLFTSGAETVVAKADDERRDVRHKAEPEPEHAAATPDSKSRLN
jgi:hypothetical protein